MSVRTKRTGSETLSPLPKASLEAVSVFGFKNSQAGVEQVPLRYDNDVEARGDFVSTKDLSNQSFSTVSDDCAAELLGRRDAQPPDVELVRQDEQRGVASGYPDAAIVNLPKIGAAANPLLWPECGRRQRYSLLTVSRLRPFARRRFSTSRPFLVLIRTRNPCVFLRCRVFGWNVRFPFMASLQL